MAYLLRGKEGVFQSGIAILSKLAKGNIHVNLDASEIPSVFSGLDPVNINKFSGPHPAGNVGVQIHHIKPIGKNDKVWTIDPLSVARIGTLFMEGHLRRFKVDCHYGLRNNSPTLCQDLFRGLFG